MKNLLFNLFFYAFFVGFSSLLHATTAPTSIIGKKFTLSIPDGTTTYMMTQVILDDSNFWEFEHENGDWEKGSYQWNTSGNTATFIEGPYVSQGAYIEISYTFSSSDSGSFTYKKYEPNSSGALEVDDEGSGTFVTSDYSTSDLPPFDTYFSDDFTSVSTSQSYWYDNIETTLYGLQFIVGDGELELIGTGTDSDELWFDGNAKSLVSVDKDWEIQAEAYANYPATGSESWDAKVGFEMEDSGLDFEFFIGPSSWGTHAHLNFEDSLGGYVHLSTTYDSLKQGTYRIRNDTVTKTFYAETLSGSTWSTVMSVNWETGAVSGATYSTGGNTSQMSNWVSMTSKYVQPSVDFMIPSDDGTIKTLSENQLGFDSFSITSTDTSIESSSVTAPASLTGKIYQEIYDDLDNSEQVTESLYFHSSSEYFGYRLGQNSGFQGTQVAPYEWSVSGNQGTLTTTLDGGTGTYSLVFETEESGQTNYSFSAGGSTTGTFTLGNATPITVPSSLVGKILTETFYDETSNENFTQFMYFESDTKLLEIQEGEVSGLYNIYNPSYTFSVSGNIGSLITSTGTDTAVYTLLFTSETGGYSDYSSSYSDILSSGSFALSNSTDGYSPGNLVNDQIIISGETYIFKANNACTIRSDSGSIDSTYQFIKTGNTLPYFRFRLMMMLDLIRFLEPPMMFSQTNIN